jgi:hypothetical protein
VENIFSKIVPNFKPENIKEFYPVPEDRPAPMNFSIETPPKFNSSFFEVPLPTLYSEISHVSLVNYTVIGPPLDASGNCFHTSLVVCFPQLPKSTHIIISKNDTNQQDSLSPSNSPPASSYSSSSPSAFPSKSLSGTLPTSFSPSSSSSQRIEQHLLTATCITLPITGGCTQVEYVVSFFV